jgi:hypothetical protein
MKDIEKRDPAELLPKTLPNPIKFESQRAFVRQTLENEVDLRAFGKQIIPAAQEDQNGASARYRRQLNSQGSPSEIIAAGYLWVPGTELVTRAGAIDGAGRRVS